MHPDPGCYEARYRVSRAAQRGWSTSLILLPTAIGLLRVNLPAALVLLVLDAITLLPIAAGLAIRQTAFRAGHAGIALGADLRDGWTWRRDRAVFVPWASAGPMLADRLHLHKSRPERGPGCPRVIVTVAERPPHRARGGHTLGSGGGHSTLRPVSL